MNNFIKGLFLCCRIKIMLRKITHIALAFLLLTATMGITVFKHYCGTELIEVSINAEAEPCCSDMGTSDCCHDETEYFQFNEDFVSPDFVENIQPADFNILFPMVVVYILNAPEDNEKDNLNFAASPPPLNLHTYLSFLQVYLI